MFFFQIDYMKKKYLCHTSNPVGDNRRIWWAKGGPSKEDGRPTWPPRPTLGQGGGGRRRPSRTGFGRRNRGPCRAAMSSSIPRDFLFSNF